MDEEKQTEWLESWFSQTLQVPTTRKCQAEGNLGTLTKQQSQSRTKPPSASEDSKPPIVTQLREGRQAQGNQIPASAEKWCSSHMNEVSKCPFVSLAPRNEVGRSVRFNEPSIPALYLLLSWEAQRHPLSVQHDFFAHEDGPVGKSMLSNFIGHIMASKEIPPKRPHTVLGSTVTGPSEPHGHMLRATRATGSLAPIMNLQAIDLPHADLFNC